MDRKEFLSAFGFGLAAVCTGGCLASCSKGSNDNPGPGPGPGNTQPVSANFTIDLNSEIKSIGSSLTKSGVIVARLAQSNDPASFTAVQVACTHQGTAIEYNTSLGNFVCPNHGSQFSTAGAVLNGPATTNLKKYKIAIAGNTMTISE